MRASVGTFWFGRPVGALLAGASGLRCGCGSSALGGREGGGGKGKVAQRGGGLGGGPGKLLGDDYFSNASPTVSVGREVLPANDTSDKEEKTHADRGWDAEFLKRGGWFRGEKQKKRRRHYIPEVLEETALTKAPSWSGKFQKNFYVISG